MANITTDNNLLAELNDKKTVLVIPAILYVAILMVLGLVGNILVCVYYGCKTKTNTNSFFIIVLAVFDLLSCTITMPIEIVDLRFFYMFTNAPACKIARFLNYFVTIGSAATLLTIAIDRHRRMCRPFKHQLQLKDAKKAFGIAVALSLILSWPSLIFYDSVSVNVTDTYNKSVILEGFDCTTTKHESYKSYLLAFNILHFVLFVVASVILGVLYSLIGRMVFKHKKSRFKYTTTRPTSSVSISAAVDSTKSGMSPEASGQQKEHASQTDHISDNGDIQMVLRTDKREIGHQKGDEPVREVHMSDDLEKEKVTLRTDKGTSDLRPTSQTLSTDIKSVRYTIMMLVITAVFVLSFLPYLVLVVWRIFQSGYEVDILSDSGLVAFQIGIRSFLLNSAINPLLYGFFNPKFKTFFYVTFCPCCAKKQGELQLSSSGDH